MSTDTNSMYHTNSDSQGNSSKRFEILNLGASYVPQQAVLQFFTNTIAQMETDEGMRQINAGVQELRKRNG